MRGARNILVAIVLSMAALGALTASGAVDTWNDGSPLRTTRSPASRGVEARVDHVLSQMTVDEKLQQLQLLADYQATDDAVRKGAGSVFGVTDPAKINHLQHVAVDQTRLHIPLIFAFDTIHGFRTTFPIPLAEASSFDPNVAATDDTIGARESAAVGLKQIYSPMVDVSHEPRWGRIAEGAGEDPYLGAVMAATRVRAAQGSDYSAPDKVVTSPKHFAAYGQPEGGREYNTTDMSEQRLRNFYLPPFKAAVDAGADTVMCSFNAISGVPGCGNHYTETDILKREWGFDGFIESDYTAVAELRACPPKNPDEGPCGHGVAADGADAARVALNAGTDSEMVSTNFVDFGKQLLAQHLVSMRRIDDAVRRILRVKFRAGLFDHPYVDVSQVAAKTMTPDDVAAERRAAARSMVLLKNSGGTLPLSTGLSSIAVIGPLANSKADPLGPWSGVGRTEDVVTVRDGVKAAVPAATVTYAQGCDVPCTSTAGFAEAVGAAQAADATVLVVGESADMSGEASSRSSIDLPGQQMALVNAIKDTGKPFTVVLMNGRPLTLDDLDATAPAILEAWFPGIQAGNAIADVLFGKVNPGGKLPVTFPHTVGQVPIYYNHEPTGRPCDTSVKWNSRYIDLPCTPLYEFGYGLSYTTFELSNLRLSSHTMRRHGRVTAAVDIKNTGGRSGDEVVQLYIHDPVATISQPVRRLRGFRRVTLASGETKTVTFTLSGSDVGFYDNSGRFVVEPGTIDVYVGDSSSGGLKDSFTAA
ncbi:MAG: glycoside hydrolase family 3 C-terminal domain-containing protein, partial [Actinomycetota bacterium]|nr:glycoside hydrolase family 3 C-terminal domain-containing protein [Actinomycetota bacterium]